MSKNKSKKNLVSNLMIYVGGTLLLVFIVFQAVNYPWKMLFARWGWLDLANDLPDPAPYNENGPVQVNYGDEFSLPGEMPEQDALFANRPAVTLIWSGIIKIPSIQVSENIFEGSGDELYYGVGHVIGTPSPGQPGNCVLAGHRSYIFMRPFRYLDKVAVGNTVYVSDSQNRYTYEVFDIFECGPDDTWVMQPLEDEPYTLTLLTCTPVIIHSNRLIARCRLTDTVPL